MKRRCREKKNIRKLLHYWKSEFPTFADNTTGCYQRKQVIADFIKQNYPPEFLRADFSLIVGCYVI